MAYYCHWLIKKTAQEMAGEWFEKNMNKDNELYKIVKRDNINEKKFIKKCWGHFVPLARACLIKSLQSPSLPDLAKDDIYEAIMLDRQVVKDTAIHKGEILSVRGHA